MASWFAPRAEVRTPVAAKALPSAPARVQARWVLRAAPVAVAVVGMPAVVTRPARAVAVAARPVPVAAALPPAPIPVTPVPTVPEAVAPVLFAPPVFGGSQGRTSWGRPPAPSVDIAALVLAQQQRAQAVALAQARAAVQDAEGRRLAAAAACEAAEDPSVAPCRP